MSTVLREQGIETIHDQVVSQVAQRWAKAFVCKVTIRTSLEVNPWADPQQQCDIVGWYVSTGGNRMEWMAEVETEQSLTDPAIIEKWTKSIVRGIPFYLLVPRGLKESVQKMTLDAALMVGCIYEYNFENDVCYVI